MVQQVNDLIYFFLRTMSTAMLSSQELIIWVDICIFIIYNTANAWSHVLESIVNWQSKISNERC